MHGSWQARISGRKFSLTTVVVLVALLVAMSGTAVATTALLVTKNKQVAPHVIAGANAPRGDNQNLVPGSVGSSDLHSGAVTAKQLGANAVTGKAVANGAISSAKLKLPSFNVAQVSAATVESNPQTKPLMTVGSLSLLYNCVLQDSGVVDLYLYASSTASGATFNGVALATEPTVVDDLTSSVSGSPSTSGFQTYLQGTHVTEVFLNLHDTSAATDGHCSLDGLALPSN